MTTPQLSRRRLVGLGAASLAGLSALSACSSDKAASGEPVTIRFSYLWTGPEAKAMEKIIAAFNKSQTRITVEGVSNPDQQAQLAALTGRKGVFDISDNFATVTGSWASKSIIQPLDEYIERDGFDIEDFVPSALDPCRYEEQVFQLPISVNNYGLFYNKALLADAGMTEPPKTFGALARAVAKLTKTSKKGIEQLGLAGANGATPSFRLLGLNFGGQWYDEGKPTPADPGNIDGADFYVDSVIKKYGVKDIDKFASGFGDYQSPQNPFYQGKLAMVIDGEWQPSFIEEFAPDLDWDVAPLPYPDGRPELANTTLVEAGSLFIPSNSQHPDEAWEFMKYLVSPEAMLEFTLALSNLPARSSLLSNKDYDKIPKFDLFLKLLESENASSIPSLPSLAQYNSDLSTADDAIVRLEKTPTQAYTAMAKTVESYG